MGGGEIWVKEVKKAMKADKIRLELRLLISELFLGEGLNDKIQGRDLRKDFVW